MHTPDTGKRFPTYKAVITFGAVDNETAYRAFSMFLETFEHDSALSLAGATIDGATMADAYAARFGHLSGKQAS